MPKPKDIHKILIIGSGLFLNFCVAGFASARQESDPEKWNTVGQVCGKAEWVDEIPSKGKANEFHEKTKQLKKVAVRLYARNSETSCCGERVPIAETLTRGDGSFAFKDLTAGQYWIVITTQGKDYSLAIKYSPQPKTKANDEAICSVFLYQVKKGQLELGKVITVD